MFLLLMLKQKEIIIGDQKEKSKNLSKLSNRNHNNNNIIKSMYPIDHFWIVG